MCTTMRHYAAISTTYRQKGQLGGTLHHRPHSSRPSKLTRHASVMYAGASPASAATGVQGSSVKIVQLKAVDLTPEGFSPFGQVIGPTDDGKQFDEQDAQLSLDRGTPRFYIMRIPRRGLRFSRITYHAQVTQCLGALAPVAPWYMAVARPTGSVSAPPRPEAGDITVFRIPHGQFVKMHPATWHAGPLFQDPDHIDFYNLELADTNVVDHNTHDYLASDGFEVEVVEV